ncbi:hypothetical protein D3C72_2166040 [compost metagenome]
MVVAPVCASGSGTNLPVSSRFSTPKAKPRSPAGRVNRLPLMVAKAFFEVVRPVAFSGGNSQSCSAWLLVMPYGLSTP